MGQLHKSAATLRIFGDDLDPDEITRLLGKPPTKSEKKGQSVSYGDGPDARERISKRGSWRLQIERLSPGNLDAQINDLLSGLTEDFSIWAAISSQYKLDLFAGLFLKDGNEGLTISAHTLQMLAARHIKLDLDIYGPDLD